MSIPFGRLVVVSCSIFWCTWPTALGAQRPALTPVSLGQVADVIFSALAPPDSSLSRVPIRERKIAFDYERTIAALEQGGGAHASVSELTLRTPVTAGTRALLDDCSQAAPKACSKLGWMVYTWLEPRSITDSEVVVQAHFSWADRGRVPFLEGVAPTGPASLVGFTSEVHLVRSSAGEWRISRLGTTLVSDCKTAYDGDLSTSMRASSKRFDARDCLPRVLCRGTGRITLDEVS